VPADHPTPDILDRLLAGAVTDAESKWALAHLLGGCAVCSRYLRGALHAIEPGEGPARYDAAVAGLLERSASGVAAIRAEHLEAAALSEAPSSTGSTAGARLTAMQT